MNEEEFYKQQKFLPKRNPIYQPFGYGNIFNSSKRKWTTWYARFVLLLIPTTMIMTVLLSE